MELDTSANELTKLLLNYLGEPMRFRFDDGFQIEEKSIRALIQAIDKLHERYLDNYYPSQYKADCYVLLKEYKNAFRSCITPPIAKRWTLLSNYRANLSLISGEKLSAIDYLALYGYKITKFGLENVDLVVDMMQSILEKWEDEQRTSLIKYAQQYVNDNMKTIFYVFNGSFWVKEIKIDGYVPMDFRQNNELEKLVISMTRQSEDTVREDLGVPKVGEGWISETDLYYKIKNQYPNNSILFHASPEWLGKQHLDIYLPEMSIAIEYQGKQHYEPVDFFGGEKAFEKRKALDEKKAKLCKRHGTRIIYVNEGYDISSIISEIETIRNNY